MGELLAAYFLIYALRGDPPFLAASGGLLSRGETSGAASFPLGLDAK